MNQQLKAQLDPGSKISYDLYAIKPYTRKELAALFGVDSRTLKNWLMPYSTRIGPKRGRYYNVTQVERILAFIGLPKSITTVEHT